MIPLLSSAALLFALAFPTVGDSVLGDTPDAPIDGGPGRGDSYFSNLGNGGTLPAVAGEWMGRPANLCVTIPPLGAVVLRLG